MTFALLSLLGAALLALVGVVERRQARFEDRMARFEDRVLERLSGLAEGMARLEGQIGTLDREVGQLATHLFGGRETRP